MSIASNVNISQETVVADHLIKFGSISSNEAFEMYGITRLSARIFKLRQRGWKISTDLVTSKNRYGHPVTFARYTLG